MSIWTFRRGFPAAALLVLLAGCAAGPDVMRRDSGTLRMPPETVAVAGRSVVIGGPEGYCIDRSASRLRGATAFVLLGSCASIARDPRAGAPRTPGVLMASVGSDTGSGPAIGAAIDQLERVLDAPAGRAALARDGRAGSVTVLDSRREDGALFVYLRDTGKDIAPGLAQAYWRGLFDVNGRLVTVSVVSFADNPLTADAGLATLRGFHARIRSETPPRTAEARPAKPGLPANPVN